MNNKKLAEIVSNILGIDESELRDDRKVAEIPNWDSFNNLQIIASVEEAFKTRFTTEEIINATKYGDVKKLLEKHGVEMK
ncbi:acyl carrier protein [Candidatus Micrarchaeota archaeon]|nr:acyl carrier protein [Candidatus Micrarchaeota archaeon]